jgi:hypothetical protein
MSSIHRAPSQVRPNAFYRVRAATPFLNENGSSTGVDMPANAILMDMGKTVYPPMAPAGTILRKIKLMDGATTGRHEGYIYLLNTSVSADIAAL